MGQELVRRSQAPASAMWSARVMLDEAHLVEQVHREYIQAGATVITLNAYAATPQRLARDGDPALFEPLQEAACAAARRARADAATPGVAIAGCLPPLVASYHADQVPTYEECLASYRRIVAAQRDTVDLFLCETLSAIVEVEAAACAAAESGLPCWVSMTVDEQDGTRLRSGQSLAAAAAAALDAGAAAVLVNCSMPEAITRSVPVLVATGAAAGAYANGFTDAAALAPGGKAVELEARTDLSPEVYARQALHWVGDGAAIVGGCCEVGPAHIASLHTALQAAGHRVASPL